MSKIKQGFEGLEKLSLGISIVVAVVIGVGVGIGLMKLLDATWPLFVGIFWGVAAAVNNVYKAYQKAKKELDEEAARREYRRADEDDDDPYA